MYVADFCSRVSEALQRHDLLDVGRKSKVYNEQIDLNDVLYYYIASPRQVLCCGWLHRFYSLQRVEQSSVRLKPLSLTSTRRPHIFFLVCLGSVLRLPIARCLNLLFMILSSYNGFQ